MTTTNLSGKRLLPGSVDFDKLDAITQATINSLLAGSKRLADIAGVQLNATLDPGASPAAGTRYLLLDVAHLHARFGSIAGVDNGDIVAYSGSAWVVDVDFSATTQTLNVWNDGDKHYWIGDPEGSAPKWKQSLGAGDFPFDPTTSIVPDNKVTVQQALAWLADATDVSVVSVDFMVASSANVAAFTAGAVRNGHTLAAGQRLLVSDATAPDFRQVYTVQASGAPAITGALGEKIYLVTVGKSLTTTSAGLYVHTLHGELRQVVSTEAGALQHIDPVFGERLSVAAALARASNDIYDALWHVCAYADLGNFTAGSNIGGHVLAAGDRIGVVDFGVGSAHSGEVYTVQASGAPTLTTARRPGRTYFIAMANGYDSLNYPGGAYTCGPGAGGYESYRLSQSTTAGLTHNDPLLGLVTVAGKFADQDAKIAAAAAGNPMQYAAEAANGALKVFTLPFTITANSKIFVDGMLARAGAGNDYTYSGAVVTLNAAGPAPVSWVGGTVS